MATAAGRDSGTVPVVVLGGRSYRRDDQRNGAQQIAVPPKHDLPFVSRDEQFARALQAADERLARSIGGSESPVYSGSASAPASPRRSTHPLTHRWRARQGNAPFSPPLMGTSYWLPLVVPLVPCGRLPLMQTRRLPGPARRFGVACLLGVGLSAGLTEALHASTYSPLASPARQRPVLASLNGYFLLASPGRSPGTMWQAAPDAKAEASRSRAEVDRAAADFAAVK